MKKIYLFFINIKYLFFCLDESKLNKDQIYKECRRETCLEILSLIDY